MIIFPAIDIKDGQVVRLIQGKFDQVSEYSQDPVQMAQLWQAQGAKWLHVVDLDGAKTGKISNLSTVLQIVKNIRIPIQMGGGVRSEQDIEALIQGGVSRVILGTRAIEDKKFLAEMLKKHTSKIAVSLDAKNGFVAQRGWQETSTIKAVDLAKELESAGVATIIYTDIAKDGMLQGPNFLEIEAMLANCKIPLIASGGVSSIEDLKNLAKLEPKGLVGAITGKAIYEGKLNLKEAIAAC